ncbi:MAG: UDP-N-acetylmuramoyl-L-alanine--D-glutamate ligase [Planctomycetota bacterium]
MIQDWKGRRVTVMGLGRFGGGVGVTRWLAAAGARVTVTDKEPAERLAASLREIADVDVTLHLGGHDERDFRVVDVVVVNPAVPESSPLLRVARDAGVPTTTEINLFVERCPARIVGITGSVGKSTITAMIGHVLEQAAGSAGERGTGNGEQGTGNRERGTENAEGRSACHAGIPTSPRPPARVWVGGNIGRSLLDGLGRITADDLVVLELSSFQLQRTPLVRWSPHVAVVTRITPNHLDWHGSFDAYRDAKLNIVRFQDPARDAVVLQDTPELTQALGALVSPVANTWRYGLDGDAPVAVRGLGASAEARDRRRWEGLRLDVPGRHNRENAAAALTVAHVLGVPDEVVLAALATYHALPHRLQRVADRDGIAYYDDSKSTTPESALTALRAFERPLVVILGGYDKGSDLTPVAHEAARRSRFAACIGTTGPRLAELIRAAGGHAELCPDLPAAVAACRQHARPGDAVLLSPACASWDQFADYRQRGEMFARLARGESV